MLTEISTEFVEARIERTISRIVGVDVAGDCVLTGMLLDSGDGYRPFQPLTALANGAEMVLPMALSAGSYTFYLTSEGFDGVGFMLLGQGLHVVTRIALDVPSSSITPSISVTEGPGLPIPSTRRSGDMHYDTTAKFWNRITEGVWQQLP
jgi:hypothetical protein